MAWYNSGKGAILHPSMSTPLSIGEAPFSLNSDVIKVALMASGYSFDADHDFFDDAVANEISATNYSSRGAALTSKTFTIDTTNDRAEMTCDPLTFSSIGNGANDTFTQIIVLREQDSGASNANSILVAHTSVASTTTNGGDITLNFSAEGLLQAA